MLIQTDVERNKQNVGLLRCYFDFCSSWSIGATGFIFTLTAQSKCRSNQHKSVARPISATPHPPDFDPRAGIRMSGGVLLGT